MREAEQNLLDLREKALAGDAAPPRGGREDGQAQAKRDGQRRFSSVRSVRRRRRSRRGWRRPSRSRRSHGCVGSHR